MTVPWNWTLLANSLLLAAMSTAVASVVGLCYALAVMASPRLVRGILLGSAVATLALPSFLVTNAWIDLLGVNGVVPKMFGFNVYSVGGAIWILALMLWPIPALACVAAWSHLEPVHFEVDPALRARRLMRILLWPTARALALTAAAIVFALASSNFAVPAILQVKVFAAEAWIAFSTNLDGNAARWLSLPLLIIPTAVLLFSRHRSFPWPRENGADASRPMRGQLGKAWCSAVFVVAGLTIALALLLPLVQLLVTPRTWIEFGPALRAGTRALMNSAFYAVVSAFLAVALGMALARVRWMGWLWLLFLAPGILLGITAVEILNRPGFEWFSRTALVVFAMLAMRYVALPRALCRTAFQSVDTLLVDAGRLDGARGVVLFRRIVWPQIAPRVIAAGYLVYLLCLWDVESILMVVPPGGETLALRIFNLLHYGHNAHVNALCVLLLFLAVAPLVLLAGWNASRRWRRKTICILDPAE